MNSKNNEKAEDDWYHKLYHPLRLVNTQYVKLTYKNKEISKNHKLLNEYSLRNHKKRFNYSKNDSPFNDRELLKRINVHNYHQLGGDNIILKNIITKIEERRNSNNVQKLKKFRINNEYNKMTQTINVELKLNKELNLPKKDDNSSLNNKGNLQYMNYFLNTPSHSENKNKRISKLTHSYNIHNHNNNSHFEININKDNNYISPIKSNKNINENENNNNMNHFHTITRLEDYDMRHRKNKNLKFNKIKNLRELMKTIQNGENDYEKSLKKLNNEILNIKKTKKYSNSINEKYNNTINLTIDYSKIKNKNDIEKKVLNIPQIHAINYLKKNIKIESLKRISDQIKAEEENNKDSNNNLNKSKKSLILPLVLNNHKDS